MNQAIFSIGNTLMLTFAIIGLTVAFMWFQKRMLEQKQAKCLHEWEVYRICKKCQVKQAQKQE